MGNSFFEKSSALLKKPFFSDYRTLLGLWLILGIVSAISKMHSHNNFMIFKGVFWHVWNQTSLFIEYPQEYFDVNHYGPLFSLVIAPFAVIPDWLGMILWCVSLSLFLYVGIRKSDLTKYQKIFIFWFCAHVLLTALFMQQFNIAIAAIVLLSFFLIEKERDTEAAFFIVLGTLVKLYGIMGLAFFFFSKHKCRFVVSLVIWSIVLFALPMLISSPEYIVGQYKEWFYCLVEKNGDNMNSLHQNISLLGMVRKISGIMTYSDLWLLIPGTLLLAIPYLRFSQYKNVAFRQTLLASVMMFLVLFSTGSESNGYITPFVGIVIWYTAAPWKRTNWDIALLIFAFVLSSLSPSDLFPAYIRKEWVQPYALKALPVTLIWFKLCYEMYTKDYKVSLPRCS